MKARNDERHYGWVALVLHWGMAVSIVGLYFLGDYMTDLDYLDPWYRKAPDVHRSLGIIVAILLPLRWGWRLLNPRPAIIGRPWQRHVAIWVHRLFYVLIAATSIAGYLISTADGRAIAVFDWFEVPAMFPGFANQEDIAGDAHAILADLLMLLVVLHVLAALKHQFIDRDATLRRMLGFG